MNSSSAPARPIRVALVEDDEEIRADLGRRISLWPGLGFAGAFADAESALTELPRCLPDVVLMDINLPGADGIECVRELKGKLPNTQFVMLTVYEDGDRLFNSLMAGASGYLLKRTPPDQLLAAVRDVHLGGAPMTSEIARRVVQYFQHIPAPVSDVQKLALREQEVLNQLAKGYRYKEIEANLQISSGTLRTYIVRIYQKLHVHSRTEAVVKYLSH
jgi:DNA-binding NarL/FixJ family response regulator